MARVVKILKTLREHKKKSIFAAAVGYFAINYAVDRRNTFLLMRDYSQQALLHGKRRLPAGAKNKHITLLLNPTAGGRKAKTKLEKYAEPLLHLSGFLVNTVKTERIDEARDLAGVIEKTNIVAIAGGDGTVFETITGLLRRADADEAVSRYQIGVIPVGAENIFGKNLITSSNDATEAKFIAESAMAIVNHKIRPVDVMEIRISENEDLTADAEQQPTKPRKPFYSLVGLEMGQYREAKKLKREMPSFFGQYFTTFWSLLRVQPTTIKTQLNYIPVCSGCGKCKKEQEEQLQQKMKQQEEKNKSTDKYPQPSIWGRITSVFGSKTVLADAVDQEENEIEKVNPECGVEKSICVESCELNIRVSGGGKLTVEIGKRLERTDFMIEGLKRLRGEPSSYRHVMECREVELCPVAGPEYFSIDNEEFEVKKVKLKALKDRVNLFVS